jgi:hypothetical protein
MAMENTQARGRAFALVMSSRTSREAAPIRDLAGICVAKVPDESATRLSGMTLKSSVFSVAKQSGSGPT